MTVPMQHGGYNATSSGNGTIITSAGELPPSKYNLLLGFEIVLSGTSLVLCSVDLYWLLRIKRTFRQDLILCLITGDILKCLAYFIFPLVVWSGLNITSSSAYCQFSGWLMAFTVEASDYMIVIISLQTMLYIFHPPQHAAKGGIWRFRYIIYVLWFIIPALLASLAFVNPHNAYVSLGPMCYLPTRPFWYRLVLAWGPRYAIFLTILASAIAIYIYVHRKLKGFGKAVAKSSSHGTDSTGAAGDASMVSDSSYNASNSVSDHSDEELDDEKAQQPLDFITTAPAVQSEPWEKVDFLTMTTGLPNPVQSTSSTMANGKASNALEVPQEMASPATDSKASRPWYGRAASSFAGAVGSSAMASALSTQSGNRMLHQKPARSNLDAKRAAIRRQLRFLFIYPVAYVIMWLFPFIYHLAQYDAYSNTHMPFWLLMCSLCSLSAQAGVDALLFGFRERPWAKKRKPLPAWLAKLGVYRRAVIPAKKKPQRPSFVSRPTNATTRSIDWWEKEDQL